MIRWCRRGGIRMTKHLLGHFGNNLIAYLALFVALGGTSYASIAIPDHVTVSNSAKAVGACTGRCPASKVYWAYFGLNFAQTSWQPLQIPAGGVPAVLTHVGTGQWIVHFAGVSDLTNCAKFANLTGIPGSATVEGFGDTESIQGNVPSVADPLANTDPSAVPVMTTGANGQPMDAAFDLLVVCGGGQGNETASSPNSVPSG
jgi:hypothetical protein